MTLYRYFLRRFLGGFLRVFAIFAGILILVGTIDQLSSLKEGQGDAGGVYNFALGDGHCFGLGVPWSCADLRTGRGAGGGAVGFAILDRTRVRCLDDWRIGGCDI